METGQIVVLVFFSVIFFIGWIYSMSFGLTKTKEGINAATFILMNVMVMMCISVFIALIISTTFELNRMRKEKLKKHVEPKYEQVTETFYRKID